MPKVRWRDVYNNSTKTWKSAVEPIFCNAWIDTYTAYKKNRHRSTSSGSHPATKNEYAFFFFFFVLDGWNEEGGGDRRLEASSRFGDVREDGPLWSDFGSIPWPVLDRFSSGLPARRLVLAIDLSLSWTMGIWFFTGLSMVWRNCFRTVGNCSCRWTTSWCSTTCETMRQKTREYAAIQRNDDSKNVVLVMMILLLACLLSFATRWNNERSVNLIQKPLQRTLYYYNCMAKKRGALVSQLSVNPSPLRQAAKAACFWFIRAIHASCSMHLVFWLAVLLFFFFLKLEGGRYDLAPVSCVAFVACLFARGTWVLYALVNITERNYSSYSKICGCWSYGWSRVTRSHNFDLVCPTCAPYLRTCSRESSLTLARSLYELA